jgi:small subunit ribosomal protein S8
MNMTDPIADLLTRIRNAIIAKHDRLEAPASKVKIALCEVLEREGYIDGFEVRDEGPGRILALRLRYDRRGTPAIRKLERVSKPGRRIYRGVDDLRPVLNGLGVAILSTPQGLLTDDEARERRLGGEVLCQLY